MSFYTSLSFYRPCEPPTVVGADLARFVRAFAKLGLVAERKRAAIGCEVRYGTSIDQDDRPSDEYTPIIEGETGGGIYAVGSIDFDVEAYNLKSLAELAGELDALEPRPIYRADLLLGDASRPIASGLKRAASEENDQSLRPESWSMELGPVLVSDLGSDGMFHVGWIGVSLSGYGYLYPWTFRDLIDRAEALEPIQSLMQLCRETWPVEPKKPPRRVVTARKRMGELWPYAVDAPWDWSWGLNESG